MFLSSLSLSVESQSNFVTSSHSSSLINPTSITFHLNYPNAPCMEYMPISWGGLGGQCRHYIAYTECMGYTSNSKKTARPSLNPHLPLRFPLASRPDHRRVSCPLARSQGNPSNVHPKRCSSASCIVSVRRLRTWPVLPRTSHR